MSLPGLCTRLAKLEAQRRSAVIAAVLRRVRQCAPSEVGVCLLDALISVDWATCDAVMATLTDTEGAAVDALIGPELFAFLEMLPASELAAITRGDPVALQRVSRSYQRWRNNRA
jgi:hypothetical protein